MNFNSNLQDSGQESEKSTTMWTRPETEEQRRYFSKHAPERRVYGWIMSLFQVGHAALAFAAWSTLFTWALAQYVFLLTFVPLLAVGTLLALHILFRTTWETYWYDRLDNDPNTDSPIAVPIIIIVALLGCEVYGAGKFLESKVETAQLVDTRPISREAAQEVANLRKEFSADSMRIERTYAAKASAAKAPYDATIRRLRGQKAKADGANARWLGHLIAQEEEKKDKAVAAVEAEKVGEMETLGQSLTKSVAVARGRHENVLSSTLSKNEQEQMREQTEKAEASAYSWIVSILLLAIIAILGWRRVRINVKSGIRPLNSYTVLDAHGSAIERIYTALSDAANRRWLQFAVWLHAKLSPKEALVSFDGTVVTKPGQYNTPEAMQSGAPAPSPTKTEEQARQEVAEKAAKAGVTLTAPQFRQEVEKAMVSNGHYKDLPLGKVEPVAHTVVAPATTGEQAQLRDLLEGGQTLDNRMRAHRAAMERGESDAEALYKDCYKALYDRESQLHNDLADMGLTWGRDKDEVFCAGVQKSEAYYPVKSLLALPYITFPPADAQEDTFLFKQEGILFKQLFDDHGNIIGLAYKGPRMEQTQTISRAQVLSRIGQYETGPGRTDETRSRNLAIWRFALSLFTADKKEVAHV